VKGMVDWKPLYSAKGSLGLADLKPGSWMNWVNSLLTSDSNWRFYTDVMAEAGIPISVDNTTRANTVCSFNSGTSQEFSRCNIKDLKFIQN